MIIEPYFKLQKELDDFVSEKLGIDLNLVEFVDKRVFALKVEIAELANETGWFKYWKQSHVMDRAATLEEIADNIHFFLSVGNSRKYTFIKELHPMDWNKVPLEHLFQYLLNNNFDSSGKWMDGFEQLLCIGYKLGYTSEEMEQAYKDKREKNFTRQRENY